jgi:hypothetical protein
MVKQPLQYLEGTMGFTANREFRRAGRLLRRDFFALRLGLGAAGSPRALLPRANEEVG